MTARIAAHQRAMRSRTAALLALTFVVLCAQAHVGTLDAFFTGSAGPYKVQVTVRPAGVVPGLAQITIRVTDKSVARVTTQAAQWNVGARGAPAPDLATRAPGDSALWTSELWLMTRSSYAVHVTLAGPAGQGSVTVPVTSIATQQLAMPKALGWLLAALGVFLSLGLVSLVGAAVRESVVTPGETIPPPRRKRARVAMALALLLLAAMLNGGRSWWNAVDVAYARGLYRPMASSMIVRSVNGARVVRLTIADTNLLRQNSTPLIPDHGKLVHLFLVGGGPGRPFAHLHPAAVDSASFEANAGALPGGRYRYFADVVHESGFAETMTGEAQLETPGRDTTFSDADDAWYGGGASGGDRHEIGGGAIVEFQRPTKLKAREDVLLQFMVRAGDGTAAVLTPYLGMPAHAVVVSDDDRVFVHLHSNGSFSMAAQRVLAAIERGDTLAPRRPGVPRPRLEGAMDAMQLTTTGRLEFPFSFPGSGRYTIWIQFRTGGAVRTAAFALTVE